MKNNNLIKELLQGLDLNLNNISRILEIFNLNINDLIDIIKEDPSSSSWLILIYVGIWLGHFMLEYSTTANDVVDSTVELPDFFAHLKENAFFENWMREVGNLLIYPVQVDTPDIATITDGLDDPIQSLFSLDLSILHANVRAFGLTDHDSAIARDIALQSTQQAAIDAINRLIAPLDISGIFNLRLFILDSPSFTYITRPFIPADLLNLPTWNLFMQINNQTTIDIIDLPHNLDHLAQEIENLIQHIEGLENIWTARNMNEDQDFLVNSSFREQGVALQALRYLEEILRLYVPFYSSWESRRDWDPEDQ